MKYTLKPRTTLPFNMLAQNQWYIDIGTIDQIPFLKNESNLFETCFATPHNPSVAGRFIAVRLLEMIMEEI